MNGAHEGADDDRVNRLLARLQRKYSTRITGELRMPATAARQAPIPESMHPALREALAARGFTSLYSHQRAAWDLAQQGEHLVVATPTASGKTLCYNLPVLDAVLSRGAKALYLFPTKALAQDQVAELMELNRAGSLKAGAERCPGEASKGRLGLATDAAPVGQHRIAGSRATTTHPSAAHESPAPADAATTLGIKAFTFDGDTPGDARKAVRTRGDIVVSNPDMLHQAILPHHTKWAQFFESLAFIVVDELHSYRGVFGSHVANVFRRLQRICQFYGVRPQFIFASATIANPAELAERLIGAPVVPVTDSGAPQGERHLLLWNPPVINPDLGIRASARSQTTRIARMATKSGLKNIVFARSRLMVEVITKYLKDVFDRDPRRPPRVLAYRGGYLPSERRAAEQALRAGRVDTVVSTSALELGVDIGALDVAVLNGYPGTIAATWQRLGRAGRRNRPCLGVLVATSDPLDQYMVQHPEFFLGASPEHARIHPNQLLILMDHVRCAAFELPFQDGDQFGGPGCDEDLGEMLSYLRDEGVLQRQAGPNGGRWYWIADSYPANAVSLRSVAEGNFVVIDISDGKQTIIAEVDYSSAPGTVYEGAIYMVQSQPYQVERLDWTGRKAFVRQTRADYYTDAIDYTRLKILDRFDSRALGRPTTATPTTAGTTDWAATAATTAASVAGAASAEPAASGATPLPEMPAQPATATPKVSQDFASISPSAFTSTAAECPFAAASHGEVHIVRRYPGYKKIRYYSHDNIGYGHIDLPDQEMHTTAVWWQAEPMALEQALPAREHAIEGFLGAAYALHHVAALRAMAEVRDLGRAVGDSQGSWSAVLGSDGRGQLRGPSNEPLEQPPGDRFEPTLFLYDNFPGGVGLSAPLFDDAAVLVQDALGLVRGCACRAGCPACVGPILAGDENRTLTPKQAALSVLVLLNGGVA
ncbi:DEAD/DEAH box helicase [Lamprobacter modestohalophilus]|uniref:DEAD/DEAH box helicase n=1 Tax=Lamprobacter modestohalophilus TaxID=1064514 RepID=UPI002ADEBA88|nr:DEAD/DEAH box helicase [Lamprobacter modestohalophilus]